MTFLVKCKTCNHGYRHGAECPWCANLVQRPAPLVHKVERTTKGVAQARRHHYAKLSYEALTNRYNSHPSEVLGKFVHMRHRIISYSTCEKLAFIALTEQDEELRLAATPRRTKSSYGVTRIRNIFQELDNDINQFARAI